MSDVNPLNSQTNSVSSSGTTNNGTKIVKKSESGGAMDKDAFLKILCAELQNIDPTQDQDSSQYVTQMAQFSSIEQMNNLNSTLTKSSYQGLIGKGVVVTDTDNNGNNYSGIVKAVYTDSSNNTMVSLDITGSDGTITSKSFNADNIEGVLDSSDETTSAISTAALNSSFLAASALAGKAVTVSTTDSDGKATKVSGTIKNAYIDNGKVMIKVTTSDGTTKDYEYSSVVKAGDSDNESNSNNASA